MYCVGYGFPVNINISCLLYDDIYQSLLSDDNDNLPVTFLRYSKIVAVARFNGVTIISGLHIVKQ